MIIKYKLEKMYISCSNSISLTCEIDNFKLLYYEFHICSKGKAHVIPKIPRSTSNSILASMQNIYLNFIWSRRLQEN